MCVLSQIARVKFKCSYNANKPILCPNCRRLSRRFPVDKLGLCNVYVKLIIIENPEPLGLVTPNPDTGKGSEGATPAVTFGGGGMMGRSAAVL